MKSETEKRGEAPKRNPYERPAGEWRGMVWTGLCFERVNAEAQEIEPQNKRGQK